MRKSKIVRARREATCKVLDTILCDGTLDRWEREFITNLRDSVAASKSDTFPDLGSRQAKLAYGEAMRLQAHEYSQEHASTIPVDAVLLIPILQEREPALSLERAALIHVTMTKQRRSFIGEFANWLQEHRTERVGDSPVAYAMRLLAIAGERRPMSYLQWCEDVPDLKPLAQAKVTA